MQDKQKKASIKRPQSESPLAMPVDQESSLFVKGSTTERKILDRTVKEFLLAKSNSSKTLK